MHATCACRYYPGCLYGATTYVECFVFSGKPSGCLLQGWPPTVWPAALLAVVTQTTIGFGNTGPQVGTAWGCLPGRHVPLQHLSLCTTNGAGMLGCCMAHFMSGHDRSSAGGYHNRDHFQVRHLPCPLPVALLTGYAGACSRISHPKQRSRSIFISESAIIARRDGILKLMFRIADIR